MKDLDTCSSLVEKHELSLHSMLNDLMSSLEKDSRGSVGGRIHQFVKNRWRHWQLAFIKEHEQRLRLEEMVEQLAKQLSHLEASVKKSRADTTAAAGLAASHNLALSTSTRSATSNSGTDDEFEDAMENPSLYDVLTVTAPPCYASTLDLNASKSDTSGGSKDEDDECSSIDEGENDKHELHVIRKKISQDEKRRLGSGSQTSSEQTSRPSTPLKPKSCRQRRTRILTSPTSPLVCQEVVHNIVIGKLWVDQHGEMSVINHTNGDKCHMKFEPYSYFGGTPKKVTGTVITADDKCPTGTREMAAQAAQRGESYEGYKPLWFKSEEDEYNGGKMTFVYNGGYWESKEKQDWGKCPDIF
ncbi:hypothetical protein TCAL_15014 [Tigriopus californicus]|uniref:Uncharacterized protein n=1 Tax=Tigriopus californicus TaxID=6832 RepID=A0A553NX71_TIGCA|nr:hypothetical protein TCAL_15014 [Tigriopus californicus]